MVLCLGVLLHAETPLSNTAAGKTTGIAPRYFGPNAFPVPEMLDGRVQPCLQVELAAEHYMGFQHDRTTNLFARAYFPLFTDRVNLTLWMPLQEWYLMTPERQRTCRLQDTISIQGHGAGDVYISTDIQLLRDKVCMPDIVLRAAVKTASGGSYNLARFYDSAGYFFDLALGKSIYLARDKQGMSILDKTGAKVELRLAASAGFLCWQTDNGRQNDAVMYGAQLLLRTQYISIREVFSGYVGWEKNGDSPMILNTIIRGYAKGFEPFVSYQYGIQDYPFHQIRVGLAYNWDILKKRDK